MYISRDEFEHFKTYTRHLLDDLTDAKVSPYCNNPRMQEIAVVWNPAPHTDFGGYPRENITHLIENPRRHELVEGSELFKETINILMEQAGFKRGKGMYVSGYSKGSFGCNMVTGVSDNLNADVIHVFYIRANGDLKSALDFMKRVDDAMLDAACRKSLKTFHRSIETSAQHPVSIDALHRPPAP